MIFTALDIETAPAGLPVTLDEFIDHARLNGITVGRQPELLNRELATATRRGEEFTRRSFMLQTLKALYIPGGQVPGLIQLPRGRVLAIKSVSSGGAVIPADQYQWEFNSIIFAGGLPSAAVTVLWDSGYGAAATDVPALIREGILEYATTIYGDRTGGREIKATADVGAGLPPGVRDVWEPFRVPLPIV